MKGFHPLTLQRMKNGQGEPFGGIIVPHSLLMRDARIIPLIKKTQFENPDEKQYIEAVFKIADQKGYGYDIDTTGMPEYVQMPYEFYENEWADCEDYSMFITTMLFFAGIPSKMCMGYSGPLSHRWNETLINGEWWILDASADLHKLIPISEKEKLGYTTIWEVTPFSIQSITPPLPPLIIP